MADDVTQAAKRTLRAELRTLRTARAPLAGSDEALAAGAQVAEHIAELLRAARRLALYLAFDHEFDPSPLGALAGEGGAELLFPRVVSRRPPRLSFHALRKPGRRAWFGALEPAEDEPEAGEPELFIIPGLGFDRRGNRLGSGGGFYDRALQGHPAALRVAPCYDFQIVSAIPHSHRDEPVDLIVTPSGAHRTQARQRSRAQET